MILKFHRRRILFFFFMMMLVYVGLLTKMYRVQVLEREEWRTRLERMQVRTNKIWRKRGTIFDAPGNPLAFSYTTWSLTADPKLIENPAETAGRLAEILGLEGPARTALEARLSSERHFEWVQRKLEPDVAARIRALKIRGLDFEQEYKRFYTNPRLAANVIGLVGTDNHGLAGIEFSYDDQLSGLAGETIQFSGLRGLEIPRANLVVNQPRGGHHLYLTIDAGIQQIADAAAERLMNEQKPTNCFVLIVDPMTGEILACAMRPTFDQSNFNDYSADPIRARNLAISHIFEPGSTFKIVTVSAALEDERVTPATPFHCPGYLELWGIKIGCTSVHGDLTMTDVVERSCNVGAMSTGVVLGPRALYYYVKKFGFGERTGVELPGEATGILRLPKDWSGLSVAAIAMGQEIGVTGIQMAMAASAIVNGGKLLKPTIIKRVTTYDNRKVLYRAQPTVRHQVISPETAAKVKTMMAGVVRRGTGQRARSELYLAGGKTGTSQKLGRSSARKKETGERDKFNEKVVTSFVGFFPYEKPQYLVYVMANEPQSFRPAGGTVAAPIFKEIATRITWHRNLVPHIVSTGSAGPQPDTSAEAGPAPHLAPDSPAVTAGTVGTERASASASPRAATTSEDVPIGVIPLGAPESEPLPSGEAQGEPGTEPAENPADPGTAKAP